MTGEWGKALWGLLEWAFAGSLPTVPGTCAVALTAPTCSVVVSGP